MKIKPIIVGLLIVVFLSATVATPAVAGSKSRHRWQGIAIGIGTAIVGHALLKHHRAHAGYEAEIHRYRAQPPHKGYRHRHHGHWEYRRVWVPPVYEKTWNPGHYNRRGHWVPGHWIKLKASDGYWKKERVWVADR